MRPKLIRVDVTDGRGLGGPKRKTVHVKTRIPDIMAYRDCPGFPYLLLAANPDTPIPTLCKVLDAIGAHQRRYPRWMYERRQLFKVPEMPGDAEGSVVALVEANMNVPIRQLRLKLRKEGVKISVAKVYRIRQAILHISAMNT